MKITRVEPILIRTPMQLDGTVPKASARETWIERYYCDFAVAPFGEQIHPKDGMFAVPQEPGLGKDPDLDIIERMRVA